MVRLAASVPDSGLNPGSVFLACPSMDPYMARVAVARLDLRQGLKVQRLGRGVLESNYIGKPMLCLLTIW